MSSEVVNLHQTSLRLPAVATPYRVLHIEDDAEVARVTCEILRVHGHQCHWSENGVRGLEALQSFQPHIILLDMMLPGISGGEILNEIRSRSDVPVIIISALANETDNLGQLPPGADDFISKPFTPSTLNRRVKDLLFHYYEGSP